MHMRLNDKNIIEYIKEKKILIDPMPDVDQISGISLDVRLGNRFRVFHSSSAPFIDLSVNKEFIARSIDDVMSNEIYVSEDQAFFLHPGELALANTYESICLPDNIVGWLDGRSSLARLGLMVHATAHRIDPGWDGQIVLEFFNSGRLPLALYPKMTIAALNFERLESDCLRPYHRRSSAKYKKQSGPVASRIDQD